MKRNKFIQIVSALSAVAVFLSGTLSCSDDDGAGETRTVEVVRAKKPFKVFGFDGQCRYSYCPSAVLNEDGSVHLFFCGNPEQHIMVDNIYHIVLDRNGNYSSVSDVLQPGASGSWDDHHTCDPSIVQGEFRWDNETYKYAMFFLGNRYGVYYNEVGVAFSNDLNSSSWRKWPDQIVRKTWTEDGDQAIGGTGKSWGVGQPCAVSLDRKGKVLLTYTIGDMDGTRVVWQEIDMSDLSNMQYGPVNTMCRTGLKNIDGNQDVTCNCDFAVNLEENKIVVIRPVNSNVADYPTYIPVASEIDYMDFSSFKAGTGQWTELFRIDKQYSGCPRNHNAALERDSFGHISDWKNPSFYYTVSKSSPDVAPEQGRHAEWTYHIWKGSVYHTEVEVPVK